jgi:hypothetical protein
MRPLLDFKIFGDRLIFQRTSDKDPADIMIRRSFNHFPGKDSAVLHPMFFPGGI